MQLLKTNVNVPPTVFLMSEFLQWFTCHNVSKGVAVVADMEEKQ